MDYLIEIPNGRVLEMSFHSVSDIRNNIILSHVVHKGSLFTNKEFGSLLHTLKSLTETSRALAESYSRECVKWMISVGKLKSFSSTAVIVSGGISISSVAVLPDGSFVPYTHFTRIL